MGQRRVASCGEKEAFMHLWLFLAFLVCSTLPGLAQVQTSCGTAPVQVHAGFQTAQELKALGDSQLQAYIRGFTNGMMVATLAGAPEACLYRLNNCVLDRNDQQLAAILRKYLSEHPEEWHWRANIVSWKADDRPPPHSIT
jgi:hypothetical protein